MTETEQQAVPHGFTQITEGRIRTTDIICGESGGGPSLMSSLWVATLPMTVGPLLDRTSRSRAAVAELVWPLQCGSGRAEGSFSRCSRASTSERNLRGLR
jgi:hypothetical protein